MTTAVSTLCWDSQRGFVPNASGLYYTTAAQAPRQIYPLRFPSSGTQQAYQSVTQTHPLRFPSQMPQPWNYPLASGLSYTGTANHSSNPVYAQLNLEAARNPAREPAAPRSPRRYDERHPEIEVLTRAAKNGDPEIKLMCDECKDVHIDEAPRFMIKNDKYLDGEKRVCLGTCPHNLGERLTGSRRLFRRHYAVGLPDDKKTESIDLELEHDD